MSRITLKAPYGQHIKLTCKNHPDKEWSTKNIGSIGQRSIFYNPGYVQGMGAECDCSPGDLTVHPCYQAMPDVAE